jgi:hypothetical protein
VHLEEYRNELLDEWKRSSFLYSWRCTSSAKFIKYFSDILLRYYKNSISENEDLVRHNVIWGQNTSRFLANSHRCVGVWRSPCLFFFLNNLFIFGTPPRPEWPQSQTEACPLHNSSRPSRRHVLGGRPLDSGALRAGLLWVKFSIVYLIVIVEIKDSIVIGVRSKSLKQPCFNIFALVLPPKPRWLWSMEL